MARGKAKGKDRHGAGRMVEEKGGDGEAWLATYADAITLLMAFFVMLYAMSAVDVVKFEALIAGFAEPFGNDTIGQSAGRDSLLQAGAGIVGGVENPASQAGQTRTPGQPSQEGDPFEQLLTQDPISDDLAEISARAAAAIAAADPPTNEDGQPFLNVSDLVKVRDSIEEKLIETELVGDVTFDITGNTLVISISADEVLFDSGSFVLRSEGQEILDEIAPVLTTFANGIIIVGHTDDVPLNRSGYDNFNLSSDRALAVLKQFRDTYDVPISRLTAQGEGEGKPLVPNTSDENRSRNRRVELKIIATGAGPEPATDAGGS